MFLVSTNEFTIREFIYSDYNALLGIATRMKEKSAQDNNYKMFYAFQADSLSQQQNAIMQFLHKAKKERNTSPRITHRLAVCTPDQKLAGNVTIDMYPTQNENGQLIYGDIGYFIDPKMGGKGLITKAVANVLTTYFTSYNRLDLTAHPDNLYSKKLIDRLHGQKIGALQASHYQGEPRDVFIIIKRDFIQSTPYLNQFKKITSHQKALPCGENYNHENQ